MTADRTVTFAEHIRELRRRVMWSLLFVAIGAGAGYALHDTLLGILQRPLHDTLYYTNPTGAFSFVIKICTVFGLLVALPVMLYQGFAFFEPLITARTRRMLVLYVAISVLLAGAGIGFAYFVSLPAALHFLVNFGGEDIESLITANEYFNFVLAYIVGFAALFQLPLIISFINRVTPLTPSKLLGGTRYVILGSFIVAAIITPTPDPVNQLLMAGPVIILYFASALVVVIKNRSVRRGAQAMVEPLSLPESLYTAPEISAAPAPPAVPDPPSAPPLPGRAPRLVSDMVVPGRNVAVPAYTPRQRQSPSPPARTPERPNRLISDFIPIPE